MLLPLLIFVAFVQQAEDSQSCSGYQRGTFSTVEFAKPIRVRKIAGAVYLLERRSESIAGVAVQICGKPSDFAIITAMTDEAGRFQIKPPAAGRYDLVVAKPGFQEVHMKLKVTRWAWHRRRRLNIELPLGY